MLRLPCFVLIVLLAPAAYAQGDLEVLVPGAAGADGTSSLVFERRTAMLDTFDIGPSQSRMDPGRVFSSGSGAPIVPSVDTYDLILTETGYPDRIGEIIKDGPRILAQACEEGACGLYVFSLADTSWKKTQLEAVSPLDKDSQGRIWALSDTTAYSISDDVVTRYRFSFPNPFQSLYGTRIFEFAAGRNGEVWLGAAGPFLNVLHFNGSDWRLFDHRDGLSPYVFSPTSMAVDSTGTMWLHVPIDIEDHIDKSWHSPLVSYNGREWKSHGLPDLDYSPSMTVDSEGVLWISGDGMLSRRTTNGWTMIQDSSFPLAYNGGVTISQGPGKIWMDGGSWIGYFDYASGKLMRTPHGAHPDLFGRTEYKKGVYFEGDTLWVAHERIARWTFSSNPTSMQDPPPSDSGQSQLLEIYPNPFNAMTTIEFDLQTSREVSLSVFNGSGQRVLTLVRGMANRGRSMVFWDGRDVHGQDVASGVYVARLTLGHQDPLHRTFTLVR